MIAACFGTVDAAFYPAFDSIAPHILGEEQLGSGNALLQGSAQISSLLGPAIAGVIIAAIPRKNGLGIAFAIDAVSFACATTTLFPMRGGNRPPSAAEMRQADPKTGRPTSLLRDIGSGLGYVWKDPVLRALLAIAAAAGVAINSPMSVGLATLAHNRFSAGAAAFGLMFTVFGVGALLGTIAAGTVATFRHRGLIVLALAAGFGAGMVAIGLLPSLILICAVLGVLGAGNGFVGVMLATWIQRRTDGAMLGRVMSVLAFSQFGVAPMSLAVAGVLAQYSTTLLFVIAGMLMAVVTAGAATTQSLRTFD